MVETQEQVIGKVAGIISNLIIVHTDGHVSQNEICFIRKVVCYVIISLLIAFWTKELVHEILLGNYMSKQGCRHLWLN